MKPPTTARGRAFTEETGENVFTVGFAGIIPTSTDRGVGRRVYGTSAKEKRVNVFGNDPAEKL